MQHKQVTQVKYLCREHKLKLTANSSTFGVQWWSFTGTCPGWHRQALQSLLYSYCIIKQPNKEAMESWSNGAMVLWSLCIDLTFPIVIKRKQFKLSAPSDLLLSYTLNIFSLKEIILLQEAKSSSLENMKTTSPFSKSEDGKSARVSRRNILTNTEKCFKRPCLNGKAQ